MNNVLDIEGYRFFQASYDEDERGSVLSVSYATTVWVEISLILVISVFL